MNRHFLLIIFYVKFNVRRYSLVSGVHSEGSWQNRQTKALCWWDDKAKGNWHSFLVWSPPKFNWTTSETNKQIFDRNSNIEWTLSLKPFVLAIALQDQCANSSLVQQCFLHWISKASQMRVLCFHYFSSFLFDTFRRVFSRFELHQNKMGVAGLIFESYPPNFENQYNFWRYLNGIKTIFWYNY